MGQDCTEAALRLCESECGARRLGVAVRLAPGQRFAEFDGLDVFEELQGPEGGGEAPDDVYVDTVGGEFEDVVAVKLQGLEVRLFEVVGVGPQFDRRDFRKLAEMCEMATCLGPRAELLVDSERLTCSQTSLASASFAEESNFSVVV